MKRILYLITELDVGGAEKALYELATRLDSSKFDPTVACLSGRGEIGQWLERKGVSVVYIDMRGWWDIPAWLRLRCELRSAGPHILHTFLFHANLAGRLSAIGLKLDKIISSVRVEEPRRTHLWIERLTRRLVDVVVCVSESSRRYTHERTRIPMAKLAVIANGIDMEQARLKVVSQPQNWNLSDDAPVVGIIGRLHHQKDPTLMLRAAEKVLAEVPDALFVFAGTGPLMQLCRREADRLGISANVRWLGWQEDTSPLLARMNVLVLSSKWEGMPNVILEAMAYGKPVVATAVGGSAELVVDGETGYLVPWNDTETLARRIAWLLRDDALCQRLGRAASQRVAQHFSIEKMVRANENLYGDSA